MELKRILATFLLVGLAHTASAQEGTLYGTDTSASAPRDRAGIFVEPFLTYTQSDSTIASDNFATSVDDSAMTTGAGLGLRLGGHVSEIFFIGADARYARLRMSDSIYGNAEGDSFNIGPTAGMQFPYFGLRAWGTYVLAGQYDPNTGRQGLNAKFDEPTGWRVGAGIRFASVSINLEYQDLSYADTSLQTGSALGTTAISDLDFDSEGYTASVSFPFEL